MRITARLNHYIVVGVGRGMTRWAKNETVFRVKLHESKNRDATPSKVCRIPRPLVEALGDPTSLELHLEDGKIIMEAGDE